MTIKQLGGVFGRNPTFNDVEIDGTLSVNNISEKTSANGIDLDGVTLKDGNVVLANGKGIDFSATSGAGTSELFDDYEEGTWTPTLNNFTGTISSSVTRYKKIGSLVHLWAVLFPNGTLASTGASSHISGNPFTPLTDGFIVNWATGYTGQANSIIVSANLYAPTISATASAFYLSSIFHTV